MQVASMSVWTMGVRHPGACHSIICLMTQVTMLLALTNCKQSQCQARQSVVAQRDGAHASSACDFEQHSGLLQHAIGLDRSEGSGTDDDQVEQEPSVEVVEAVEKAEDVATMKAVVVHPTEAAVAVRGDVHCSDISTGSEVESHRNVQLGALRRPRSCSIRWFRWRNCQRS